MLEEWGIEVEAPREVEEYVPEKPKGKNAFEIMMSAFNKKFKPTQAEKESIPEFLFHQILSNDPQTIELALMFTTSNIPVDVQYNMIRNLLPKCYIPYPKKAKNTTDETIENISQYYNCSIKVAVRYAEMMPPEEIDRINNKYKTGKVK